jgi:sortase A
VDYSANTTTGSHLLTYEKAVDIGIFDGRHMTVARRSRPVALAPVEEPPTSRSVLPLTLIGIALALVGVIAVGYAAFQLYGTNILTARTQSDLATEFAARLAAGVGEYTPGATPTGTAADPSAFDDPDDVPVIIGPVGPARPFPLEEAALYSWLYEGPPELGVPLARIVIPAIGVDRIVVEGVGVPELRKGPGHMSDTAIPGQLGNAVISGHRTTWGAPFNRIDELEPGDQITVETMIGTHTYEVVSSEVVWPSESWVTHQWEGAWLTLTTCTPEGSSRHRLIVFAKLVDGPNAASVESYFDPEYLPPKYPG